MPKKMSSEKKTVTKSFKISQEDAELIEQKAASRHMNFSQYVTDCALHGENALTPGLLCKLENMIEQCKTMVGRDHPGIEKINQEERELWESLK